VRPLLRVVTILLLLLPALAAALDAPSLRNRRVNDDANIIPAETRQRLEQKLAELERRTTNQIAVLTVESLEGDPIEDFSLRVAEAWKLGQAGKDNGVLLVVSEADRRMRIEVGYGLEPVLTDLETSIIQRDIMVPAFRQGDYGGGIEAGVDAMIAAIGGEEIEPAAGPEPLGGRGGQAPGSGLPSFLLFALIFLVPFSLSAARSGSWLVGLFLTPFYFFLGSMVAPFLGIIAAGVWIVAFTVLRLLLPRRPGSRYRRDGGWWIGPGFGGGGGGWGGGGGFGGGGFSGGGGSFGGGGSSSSW
jgi:uncharacterized protein